ncbi:MAG: hypothetical protein AB7S69_03645 [Salinivirgaceae bacterium]
MKEIPGYDIVIGTNDTSHFVHEANSKKSETIPLRDFFENTERKRKWSIVNPGFVLGNAYMYFVYGQEKGLLNDFSIDAFLSNIIITEDKSKYDDCIDKSDYLKRRLRNSLAHCRYRIEIRSKSQIIENDGDVWFVFSDSNKGKDKITFEMSFPTFGNLIEKAGQHTLNNLR